MNTDDPYMKENHIKDHAPLFSGQRAEDIFKNIFASAEFIFEKLLGGADKLFFWGAAEENLNSLGSYESAGAENIPPIMRVDSSEEKHGAFAGAADKQLRDSGQDRISGGSEPTLTEYGIGDYQKSIFEKIDILHGADSDGGSFNGYSMPTASELFSFPSGKNTDNGVEHTRKAERESAWMKNARDLVENFGYIFTPQAVSGAFGAGKRGLGDFMMSERSSFFPDDKNRVLRGAADAAERIPLFAESKTGYSSGGIIYDLYYQSRTAEKLQTENLNAVRNLSGIRQKNSDIADSLTEKIRSQGSFGETSVSYIGGGKLTDTAESEPLFAGNTNGNSSGEAKYDLYRRSSAAEKLRSDMGNLSDMRHKRSDNSASPSERIPLSELVGESPMLYSGGGKLDGKAKFDALFSENAIDYSSVDPIADLYYRRSAAEKMQSDATNTIKNLSGVRHKNNDRADSPSERRPLSELFGEMPPSGNGRIVKKGEYSDRITKAAEPFFSESFYGEGTEFSALYPSGYDGGANTFGGGTSERILGESAAVTRSVCSAASESLSAAPEINLTIYSSPQFSSSSDVGDYLDELADKMSETLARAANQYSF